VGTATTPPETIISYYAPQVGGENTVTTADSRYISPPVSPPFQSSHGKISHFSHRVFMRFGATRASTVIYLLRVDRARAINVQTVVIKNSLRMGGMTFIGLIG
jgi:hypothetical protein